MDLLKTILYGRSSVWKRQGKLEILVVGAMTFMFRHIMNISVFLVMSLAFFGASLGSYIGDAKEIDRPRIEASRGGPTGISWMQFDTSWFSEGQIQEIKTGQVPKKWVGHSGNIFAVALSNNSGTIATCGSDGIRLWDLSGKEFLHIKTPHLVRIIAWSPDGRTLASGEDASGQDHGIVRAWNAETGKEVRYFEMIEDTVTGLVFSLDGKKIIASGEFVVEERDTETGKLNRKIGEQLVVNVRVPRRRPAPASDLTVSSDGKAIAWIGKSLDYPWFRRVFIIDRESGKERRTVDEPYLLTFPVAFSPDKRMLAVGKGEVATGDKALSLVETNSGKERMLIPLGNIDCWSITFLPKCWGLAGACSDGWIRIWDVSNGRILMALKGHQGKINQLVSVANGEQLISCGEDGMVLVWKCS